MRFSGTWGEGREAAAADGHWDQEWELKREYEGEKGAEATGRLLHGEVVLDQTQGDCWVITNDVSPG